MTRRPISIEDLSAKNKSAEPILIIGEGRILS
jgi:hypothetical protein